MAVAGGLHFTERDEVGRFQLQRGVEVEGLDVVNLAAFDSTAPLAARFGLQVGMFNGGPVGRAQRGGLPLNRVLHILDESVHG